MSKRKNKRRPSRRRKKKTLPMPLILLLGGVLLAAAGFALAARNSNSGVTAADPSLVTVQGQPSLKVDQELIDYGDVKLNTNLTFTLTLTNVGDKTLRISETPYIEVREGC